ncbi:hypothetical protein [Rhodocista pekingensis]|uniref:CopG family transcriptional regulator n=1 Tax=Rhodocista pekingensis TaxID=201185 RepID=A0ABW2L0A1_9PROT
MSSPPDRSPTRPPAQAAPAAPEPAGPEDDQRRKAALADRLRTRVDATARARGEDPYEMLARAIRHLLRS